MSNETDSKKPAPTIWRVPDDLWAERSSPCCPNLVPKRSQGVQEPQIGSILYVLQTDCQWKAVPKEFSSGSTCHYDELKGIDWQRQALDSAIVKAPLGGEETEPNPTDRGKSGSKRHLITEEQGVPLGTTLSGANLHEEGGRHYRCHRDRTPPSRRAGTTFVHQQGLWLSETREEMAKAGIPSPHSAAWLGYTHPSAR